MATTSNRQTIITDSGDVSYSQTINAAANPLSPAKNDYVDLALGANTITPPTAGGTTPTSVTIIPPAGNAQTLTLKGVTGDTGVLLHKTDPTTIALGGTGTFVLTAGAIITGVRLLWS
jgi:hypothetical protein